MKLIIITEPETHENEHETIKALFKAGMRTLHVRKPSFTREMMQDYLEKIPGRYHSRVVIHSHYELARKMKLKGIHLPEKSRNLTFLKRLQMGLLFAGKKMQISASFHKLDHLNGSIKQFKYVFFSPVFESISKDNHKPKYSLRMIYNKLSKLKAKNIIALGGVDDTKISLSKDAGFNGVAVLGYIWQAPDPVAAFRSLKDLCKEEEEAY